MHPTLAQFQGFVQHWGLLAVFALLFLENFGLPLPGEITLLYAGFHQRAFGGFGFASLLAAGSLGSALGQAGSYACGRFAGAWTLRRTWLGKSAHSQRFRDFFAHHGPPTILVSRFVPGLRMFAGWAAGLAPMEWRRFLVFNFLGAALWVTALSLAGWTLGAHWRRLLRWFGRLDILILAAAIVAVWMAWQHLKARRP